MKLRKSVKVDKPWALNLRSHMLLPINQSINMEEVALQQNLSSRRYHRRVNSDKCFIRSCGQSKDLFREPLKDLKVKLKKEPVVRPQSGLSEKQDPRDLVDISCYSNLYDSG